MYDRQGIIVDQREMLRVKVKSLAAEARIIRQAELREKKRKQRYDDEIRARLHSHRVLDVRRHSRCAHLAYGFIRGRTHLQMENKVIRQPDWEEVKRLCKKYGPRGWNGPTAEQVDRNSA